MERTLFAMLLLIVSAANLQAADKRVEFHSDIAPLMKKYCAGCHNANEAEGDVRLDTIAEFPQNVNSQKFIVAGNAEASHLLALMRGTSDPKMPPDDEPQLTEKELQRVELWIRQGARIAKGSEIATNLTAPMSFKQVPASAEGVREVNAMAVDRAGTRVALAKFARIDLLDPSSGKLLRTISGLPGKVNSLRFAAGDRYLLAATGIAGVSGQAVVIDLNSEAPPRTWNAEGDTFYAVDMSADGKLIAAAGYDRTVRVWNAQLSDSPSLDAQYNLTGHNGAVYALRFDPTGQVLATASADETVKLWNMRTGQRLDTLGQPLAEQYCVTFTNDGKHVIAAGADNRIRAWRLASRTERMVSPLLVSRFAHEKPIVAIALSKDDRLLCTAAEDGTVKLWNTTEYRLLHQFDSVPGTPTGVAVSSGEQPAVHASSLSGEIRKFVLPSIETALANAKSTTKQASPNSQTAGDESDLAKIVEQEPNDSASQAQPIAWPCTVEGVIAQQGSHCESDCFRFTAEGGQRLFLEVSAAREKSPLDSMIEVLNAQGQQIVRVQLQAVRDSYFTFRGKNSTQVSDFRVHNWQEMELNEYLYCNGEVVKLWLYPRGPDSGFTAYPGYGNRYTYFGTTGNTHALNEPAYIVNPLSPSEKPLPNGLPVFKVYYENDDDSLRRWGSDSRLEFVAPEAGEYIIRLRDAQGIGSSQHKYKLTLRHPKPDFTIAIKGRDLSVRPGVGAEFMVRATRLDGFDGPINIDVDNLPPGFVATSPLTIQEGHTDAVGTITAIPGATNPAQDAEPIKLKATARINGQDIQKPIGDLGQIKLDAKEAVVVHLMPMSETEPIAWKDPAAEAKAHEKALVSTTQDPEENKPDATEDKQEPTDSEPPVVPKGKQRNAGDHFELVIHPGQTISARILVERGGFKGRITFGKEESGRNLPHGVYVDNIGLNGLMIPEGQSEREFFITAAPWVPETDRLFHLKAAVGGNPTTWPVLLKVRNR